MSELWIRWQRRPSNFEGNEFQSGGQGAGIYDIGLRTNVLGVSRSQSLCTHHVKPGCVVRALDDMLEQFSQGYVIDVILSFDLASCSCSYLSVFAEVA